MLRQRPYGAHRGIGLVEDMEEGLNWGSEKEHVTHALDVCREYAVRERGRHGILPG